MATPAPPDASPQARVATPRRSRWWIVVLVLVLSVGAGLWWHYRATATARPVFPRDPELIAVRKLIFGLDATVADYARAEATVRARMSRSPEDPEVAVVAAEVSNWYFLRGFDRAESRLWDMGSLARHALQLAADEPSAIAAVGEYQLAREVDLAQATTLLRRAIALDPTVARWHSSLAEALRRTDPAAGLLVLQQAVERFPTDALVRYNLARHYRDVGRLDDMERELDAVIAMEPIANALLWKARVQLWAHGDSTGMKATLDRVPGPMRISERAAVNLFIHACVTRQPDDALANLRALPSGWIDDFDFVGPKSLLLGLLLEQQGLAEEARREFQNAYAEVARRQPQTGRDPNLRNAELWTLIALGRTDEARAALTVHLSKLPRPYRLGFSSSWWFSEIPATVALGEDAQARQLLREAAGTDEGLQQLRIAVRIDPRMATWREEPEVASLLQTDVAEK